MSHQGYYLHPDTGKPVTSADWPLGVTQEQYDQNQMEAELLDQIQNLFPALSLCVVEHSCGSVDFLTLHEAITHLNDFHEWSFTDIADYLETLDVDLSVRKEVSD